MKKYLIAILTSSDINILQLSIESALNQTYKDYDIYVVVNTLKEGYFEDVKKQCDSYNIAKIVQTTSNGKPGKGHNSVLSLFKKEKYEYLVMCDGDDFLYPIALTRIENILNTNNYDVIALCGRSSSISISYNKCKEQGDLISNHIVYENKSQVCIDRMFFKNISTDFNNTLATPCRLLVTKNSFATQQENLFDERMQIYDDYYMFLSLYKYFIDKQYNIGFLCDPYLYLYNYTNPNSVSHRYDSKYHKDNIYYNSYDVSNLDVSKINVHCHFNLTKNEMLYIRLFERKVQNKYLYYNTNLQSIINNKECFTILFVDNGTDWDYSTIHKRSLRGTENAMYRMSHELSVSINKQIVLLTKSGIYKEINPFLKFDNLNKRSHYTFDIAIHQGIFMNEPIFYQKKNILYIHHDINVECIQKSFSKSNIFDKYIYKYIFVSQWQKERFIKKFKLSTEKCEVIQNAISPTMPIPSKHFKKSLSLIFVSSPYRGLLPLLPLFDRLIAHYPTLRLKVFSSFHIENTKKRHYLPITNNYMQSIYNYSQYDKYYINIYNYMINHSNIDFYGNVPQNILFQHMKSSMIMLYPCTFPETCCTSVLEAMANRCFVISSDMGALRETTNDMGYLYDPKLKYSSSVIDDVLNPPKIESISPEYQTNIIDKCKELLDKYYSDDNQLYLNKQQQYILSSCLWSHKVEIMKKYLKKL